MYRCNTKLLFWLKKNDKYKSVKIFKYTRIWISNNDTAWILFNAPKIRPTLIVFSFYNRRFFLIYNFLRVYFFWEIHINCDYMKSYPCGNKACRPRYDDSCGLVEPASLTYRETCTRTDKKPVRIHNSYFI